MADEIINNPIPNPIPEAPQPEAPQAPAPDTEADEWAEAEKEHYSTPEPTEKKEEPKPEEKKEEPKKPEEVTPPVDPTKPKDPVETPPENTPPAPQTELDVRAAQREYQQEFSTVKDEVKQAYLKDVPTELKDADGDVIKGVEDVLKLVDPRTGKQFTEEAASIWLMQAQQGIKDKLAEAEDFSTKVATVNLTVKDEANQIMKQFSEVFKANPDLNKQLWDQYSKTLTMSPDNQYIVHAPVSLAQFYATALQPYSQVTKLQQEAQAAKDEAEKIRKKQEQADRGDIHGAGPVDTRDTEDKEWDDAAKEYYNK